MRAKKKKLFYWIFLSSSIKKIYSLSFSLSLFGFSYFFLFPSHFFSLLYLLSASPIYSRSSSSLIFIVNAHVAVPRRRPILPSPPSHRSPNSNKPSPPSHRRSKLHCWPKLHRQSKLHRHRLHRTQERCRFCGCGWISWVSLGFVKKRDFSLDLRLISKWVWVYGLGIGGFSNGYQWLWQWVWAVGWVGFCSGFQFVSQWVSVDFSVFCNGFW